jgi:hypothetical protein
MANQGHMKSENTLHYFHNPADTLYVLSRALPYLPSDTRSDLADYLVSEYNWFHPGGNTYYKHLGFQEGASREQFIYDNPPSTGRTQGFQPESFYGLYKYAEEVGKIRNINVQSIFNDARGRIKYPPPSDKAYLPYIQNAYITGHYGYLELQKLAGQSESSTVRSNLNSLLNNRVNNFRYDISSSFSLSKANDYYYVNIHAWNFMYLSPHLGDHLNKNARSKVKQALDYYTANAPYWMVALNEEPQQENGISPYHQTHALFQAKALILKEPRSELVKYLDTPVYPVGDLYYINNLVSAIAAN